MSEWRLFDRAAVPAHLTRRFFVDSPHVPPANQRGHAQRISMVATLVAELVEVLDVDSVTDLGCGDGSLLAALKPGGRSIVEAWGYDLSTENLKIARRRGVEAHFGDVLDLSTLELGELVVATELVEHLIDPHGWLAALPRSLLVVSSPYDERPGAAYEHHAWAWDQAGYRELVAGAGWTVREQRTCPAGFQVIYAGREVDQL